MIDEIIIEETVENKRPEFKFKDTVILTLIYFVGVQSIIAYLISLGVHLYQTSVLGHQPSEKEFNYILVNFFVFLVGAVIVVIYSRKQLWYDLKVFFRNLGKNLLKVLKNYGLGMLFMIGANSMLQYFDLSQNVNQEVVEVFVVTSPVLMSISTVILAPILEEVVFRGGLFKGLETKTSTRVALVVSSIAFGAIHVLSSMTSLIDILHILPYSLLGFFMAKSYKDTDSIWGGILYHVIQNGLATFLLLSGFQ